ncbi:hypothetical protein [Kitasatospora sp. NPDC091207]|uniref:hypothetical protein n=1 Tax=Kitasatospora sp. NPDC091207 TaxID=3364083 RepID=UPI0037F49119
MSGFPRWAHRPAPSRVDGRLPRGARRTGGADTAPGPEDSVENASTSTIGVWVYPWFYGDANDVLAGRGGSPTSNLRNNEASWGTVDQLNRGGRLHLD